MVEKIPNRFEIIVTSPQGGFFDSHCRKIVTKHLTTNHHHHHHQCPQYHVPYAGASQSSRVGLAQISSPGSVKDSADFHS